MPSSDRLVERLSAAVEQRRDELIAFAAQLVQAPSVTGEEALAQRLVSAAARDAGLDVAELAVDPARVAPRLASAARESFATRGNVHAVRRGRGGGRSLLLNGHVDVVPAGDPARWTRPPFAGVVEDGRLWGRGACDMKAGVAASLFAIRAVHDAGVALAGDVALLTTVGEETGGAGAIAWALDNAGAVDGVIVAEPTRARIAPAHTGAQFFRVTLTGRAAHACMRETGVSAIEQFVSLHTALLAYEEERNAAFGHPLYAGLPTRPLPTNVGVVRGGEWPVTVPESLAFEGRIGTAPGEDSATARAGFEERLRRWTQADAWASLHPPVVEWLADFAGSETPAEHPLVTTLSSACEAALGRAPIVEGMTYGTDMAHFVRLAGLPCVLFGPGDVRAAHFTDEHVELEQVVEVTKALASAVVAWCGAV
ncbi:ArgE/DapE family deacylase [Conexibacter woesei]|uniref:Probable succinyl-diaminopimelate desuccinylase n=1 Tax=Conexibacter woesei (strain DSM 14684 / CCUG 47730 / CIP 108061 / JCM 11494 / NBRC 100937 / ID131577) TaxID=469383 RepID=D3F6H8_CONWI|nr:ArgE/DapE family deacylase [Conexibacter woesei]ADB50745.1 acetylornithine deacetylase or succinyl- diaminopimelate desuccinylase [Conexibacter woesei DSM 14684]